MRVAVAHRSFFLQFREVFTTAELCLPERGYFPEADLVIFTGGEDVNPRLYGEDAQQGVYFSEKRDALEIKVFENYFGRVPMLGVCRGHQLLNVLLGGTLIQDIRIPHYGYHQLNWEVEAPEELKTVNSMHHQGIKDIGTKLPSKVLATFDGIIEAISWEDSIVGVQFHPEMFASTKKKLTAFDYLLSLLNRRLQ